MLSFVKRAVMQLFWDFGALLCLLSPVSVYLTFLLICDSLRHGFVIPHQGLLLLCGVGGASILTALLIIWLHLFIKEFRAVVGLMLKRGERSQYHR